MTGDLPRGMGLFMALYLVTTFLTDMVYFIWFHGTVGQTLGKMLLGLRVIRISGEKMTLGIAFLRWVGSLVSGLFVFLGFIWIAFDGSETGLARQDRRNPRHPDTERARRGSATKGLFSPTLSPGGPFSERCSRGPYFRFISDSHPPATPEDRVEPTKSA